MIIFILIIYFILQAYLGFMGLNILFSWFPRLYDYKFFRGCRTISDWYLGKFRGIIIFGPLDITPIIGLMLYQFIISMFFNILQS
jgi:uncharacterized protein YggT (Ycf19 family)